MTRMRSIPALLILATAVGCSAEVTPPPSPLPTLPAPVVTLTSPTGTVFTRATVKVEVAVSEGDAEKVELLAGGQVIASSSAPPYSFEWDTASVAEGPHVLWARASANGKTFTSAQPQLVVVDRTAPRMSGFSPSADAVIAGTNAAVTLTFNEPLLASSVDASKFTVADRPAASARLSEDGHTLTLQSAEGLSTPVSLHTSSFNTGLTDLAGNPMGEIHFMSAQLVPEWTARFPLLGTSRGSEPPPAPALVFDASNQAYIVWASKEGTGPTATRNVAVRRWDGTSWVPRGGGWLNTNNVLMYSAPSLVLDSAGTPLVAFPEWDSTGNDANAWVYRWDGGKWVNLGDAINAYIGKTIVWDVALTVAGTTPILAWAEANGTQMDLLVRQWDGTSWKALGGKVNTTPGESVNSGFDAHSLSLITDRDGKPVIAWSSTTSGITEIHVARYTGSAWERLGSAVNVFVGGNARQPSLAIDKSDPLQRPYLAWVEHLSSLYADRIYAAHWTGTAWEALGEGVNEAPRDRAAHPTLAIHDGRPFVAWSEPGETTSTNIQVRDLDPITKRWRAQSASLSVYPSPTYYSSHASNPWLVTDANGRLTVAFSEHDENGNGGVHIYSPK